MLLPVIGFLILRKVEKQDIKYVGYGVGCDWVIGC